MKIIAIIPARGGSKGIPGKNIKLLGGKPLLSYTIESALRSGFLDEVMVSTEDERIAEIAAQYGLPVPFMRPAELAMDNSPSIDVVSHVLTTYAEKGMHFDAVMLLEPTSPFRDTNEIDESIQMFLRRKSDSFVTVRKVPDAFNPYWVFEEGPHPNVLKTIMDHPVIQRRQSLPNTFVRDGSVYITKTKVVLEQHSLFGDSISYQMRNDPFRVNIDTMEDWREAERVIQWVAKARLSDSSYNFNFLNS